MSNENSQTSSIKACIVYLVDTGDRHNFRKSLQSLKLSEALAKYPIIAFHESDLGEEFRCEITRDFGVIFVLIEFELPDYPEHIRSQIQNDFYVDCCPYPFSLGYRHMCSFFSGPVFNMHALDEYDYAMRLDTDSFLLEPLEDVFETMVRGKFAYGFRDISVDHPKCYEGFYHTFVKAVENLNFNVSLKLKDHGIVYYTNWEVYKLDIFRGEPHQSIYRSILESGGNYIHRWGDHIFRYAFLTQFNYRVCQFDFNYQHGDDVYSKGKFRDDIHYTPISIPA